jgi:hypothetical protein
MQGSTEQKHGISDLKTELQILKDSVPKVKFMKSDGDESVNIKYDQSSVGEEQK